MLRPQPQLSILNFINLSTIATITVAHRLKIHQFFLGSVIPPTEGTNIKTDELTALVVSSSREKKWVWQCV